MPRPGPRPYDCVRRAWHSDTHQPIRGTLIQEIFRFFSFLFTISTCFLLCIVISSFSECFLRVVNDIHGSNTKKNKEYQEKLPVVVLRAEEIMYSKANSEVIFVEKENF